MISPAILAVLLTQTVATEEQVVGALSTMQSAVLAARAGSRQLIVPGSGKRACIRPATTLPAGTVTVQFGVSLISSSFQNFLGLPVPAHIPTSTIDPVYSGTWFNPETQMVEPHLIGTVSRALTVSERWGRTGDQYAVFEVQAVPTTAVPYNRALWADNVDVIEQEMFLLSSPDWAPCEVAMFRIDDPSIASYVRCGCWDGSKNCTYQRINEGGGTTAVACPKGMTMRPGSFSGPGAVAKPCYVRFDTPGVDRSWPPTCPK